MTTLRRRVLRPPVVPAADVRPSRREARLRTQLQADQQSLTRWMTKLKRAFHTMEQLQSRIRRTEKLLNRLGSP